MFAREAVLEMWAVTEERKRAFSVVQFDSVTFRPAYSGRDLAFATPVYPNPILPIVLLAASPGVVTEVLCQAG